jgi:hypothetical protein
MLQNSSGVTRLMAPFWHILAIRQNGNFWLSERIGKTPLHVILALNGAAKAGEAGAQ